MKSSTKSFKAEFGYCALTADCLHIGHINFLNKCKEKCDKLIVAIMSDECVEDYKGQEPLNKFHDRAEVIQSLKQVYVVWKQTTFEFGHSVLRMKDFHDGNFVIFDSEEHKREGADYVIPRTKGISSSKIKSAYNSELPI